MPQKRSRKQRRRDRGDEPKPQPEQNPQISFWMVAFVDLLGYREVLKGLDVLPLPTSPAEIDKMKRALARASWLQNRLHRSFETFMSGHDRVDPDLLQGVPQQSWPIFEAMRATRILHTGGPDNYMMAASLAPSAANFPARAAYALVSATAGGMLMHLAIGSDDPTGSLPLRGGIDVAAGGVVSPARFPYTPALSRAYELESKEADYPRTLIGDRVEDFLTMVAQRPGDDIRTAHARQVAERTRALFFRDTDGKLALDFYGPIARETFGGEPAGSMGKKAWIYATAAERLARGRGDLKVIRKYERLIAYMGPRRPYWD